MWSNEKGRGHRTITASHPALLGSCDNCLSKTELQDKEENGLQRDESGELLTLLFILYYKVQICIISFGLF